MSVKDSHTPAQIFPVIRFKALNYVFESSTSLKVMMNLLALPPPYLTDSSDLYPHSGKLSGVTYRTPWVREKVMSSCKISISGSVLEDLRRTKQHVDLPERFIVSDEKSDSAGQQNEESTISDPWQEVFLKWTPEPKTPERLTKDLLLEELVSVDHVSQFKRHLPKLETIVSKLKMMPIEDPLLNSTGKPMTADAMFSCFKRCESYEKPTDVETKDTAVLTNSEIFVKESLDEEDLLLLSPIVDMPQLTSVKLTAFSTIRHSISISPEHLDEEPTIQEMLQTAFPLNNQSMDICPYDLSEKADKENAVNESLFESETVEHVRLPSEMEMDLPITPTQKNITLNSFPPISELLQEPMSPPAKLSLVSARAQEEMMMTLWKAEKHPPVEARLMLAEPHIMEPAVDFKPLSDAMKAFKPQKESLTGDLPDQCDTEVLQQVWGSCRDFIENMEVCCPSIVKENMEEFQKLQLTRVNVESLTLNLKDKTPPINISSQKSVNIPPVNSNTKEPDATSSTEKVLNEKPTEPSAHTNIINSVKQLRSEPGQNSRPLNTDQHRVHQPERDHDPLSAFLTLRSQQGAAQSATPQSPDTSAAVATESVQQQTAEDMQTPGRRPEATLGTIVTGSASREQEAVEQTPEERPDCTVVQVQATVSQHQAFCELLAFAQPCLTAAKKLSLNFPMWVDFISLAPDQTHFLLKQQERALYRTAEGSSELLRDQELLFNQTALIHVLVTFKELLLKCDLRTAVEYLSKAAETCEELSLKHLLRRLNIILHLSEKNQESNHKLLKMQQLLSEQLHNRNGLNITEKILVIMSVESDQHRSLIINTLKHVTDLNVIAVFPKDGDKKLCGASVVSSVQNSACVVVYEQHIGPDFPWTCFFLVVEFDHPGPSPWAKLCKERNISHLSFNTSITDTEEGKSPWCLEDNIPFVVIVTEGLLNCPLLLQTLESSCNVTVLERSYCPTLQMLGSTNNYSVVTVDESTAVIIQDQFELSQDRVSDAVVMRLTAVSLQYSHCWLILYCPDSQGGGFSSEAFSSLVLVYSSLVIFGMSEDLPVKVLIVSDVLELAKSIRQICFHTFMLSNRDCSSYLDRDWLSVMPSEDEMCLSKFHCINPLVSQLMLHKAPSLKWLLSASLSQLQELFPQVPHKVLKLFSETTSLYQPQPDLTETKPDTPLKALWAQNIKSEFSPELDDISHLFGATSAEDVFGDSTVTDGSTDFRVNPSPFFDSSQVSLQEMWTGSDPWRQEDNGTSWSKLPGCKSRAKAFGRDVQRKSDEQMPPSNLYTHNRAFELIDSSWQEPTTNQKYSGLTLYSELQHPSFPSDLSLPAPATWSHGLVKSERMNEAPAVNGSRCWRGLERKRSPEDVHLIGTALTPLKKGRLSYERVPGRTDGQTRLRLF